MSPCVLSPVIPWPWLALIAVALAAAIAWTLRCGVRSTPRAVLLGAVRGLALAGLLAILLQPQRRHDQVTALRPQLAVLVDDSVSMTDTVDESQPRRSERAREFLDSPALKVAREDFDVRLFAFDKTLREQTGPAAAFSFAGERSDLVGALVQVQERFRGQPLAGVLLVSDGLNTADGAAPPVVRAGTAVFAVELEKPFSPQQRPKHVRLGHIDHPKRLVVGWDTEVRVNISATGMNGETVGVELWRDGERLRETTVAFNEDEQTREVAFNVAHSRAGIAAYEVRLVDTEAAGPTERVAAFLIEVIEPGNRVLCLQNALGFDLKFLRRAFVTDRNLQLAVFVRWHGSKLVGLSERGVDLGGTTLDFSQKTFANYAVLILGDLAPAALTASDWTAMRDFVDRGGGLVLMGGPNLFGSGEVMKTPLAELLPVGLGKGAEYREGSFAVEITDLGLRHPIFGPFFEKVRDFPSLLTCNLATEPVPTAEVLMQLNVDGRRYPLVVSRRFGQGRVVAVLTDTLWRWRLAAKGWGSDRSPYDTFWAQLMAWLIPKEHDARPANRLELFTERTTFHLGEKPELRALVDVEAGVALPAMLPLTVRTPDEKVFEYVMQPATLRTSGGKQVPGFRVEVEPHMAGVFRAGTRLALSGTNVEAQTHFVVARPATELTGQPIQREWLRRTAEASGGRFYAMEEWDNWRTDLRFEQQQFSRVQLLDLWNHPALLAVVLVLLMTDWCIRKKWNLP